MNLADALGKTKQLTFEECKKQVVDSIFKNGKTVRDAHLDRTVIQSIGTSVIIPKNVIEELEPLPLLEKYAEDSTRMSNSFDVAVEIAQEDPNSRQLVILNTEDYLNVKQCFQLMHFVLDDGEYQALVYQRSADVVKLKDDWIFFSRLASQFVRSVNKKLKHITVYYGNIHTEVKI